MSTEDNYPFTLTKENCLNLEWEKLHNYQLINIGYTLD